MQACKPVTAAGLGWEGSGGLSSGGDATVSRGDDGSAQAVHWEYGRRPPKRLGVGAEPGHQQQDLVERLQRQRTRSAAPAGPPPPRRRPETPRARSAWRDRETRPARRPGGPGTRGRHRTLQDRGTRTSGGRAAERARLVAASSHSSCSNRSLQRAATSKRASPAASCIAWTTRSIGWIVRPSRNAAAVSTRRR